jgi:hypothetical protein
MEYPLHWTCEATVARLGGYLLRTLALEEALAVAEHCEACGSCFQLLMLNVEGGLSPESGARAVRA